VRKTLDAKLSAGSYGRLDEHDRTPTEHCDGDADDLERCNAGNTIGTTRIVGNTRILSLVETKKSFTMGVSKLLFPLPFSVLR